MAKKTNKTGRSKKQVKVVSASVSKSNKAIAKVAKTVQSAAKKANQQSSPIKLQRATKQAQKDVRQSTRTFKAAVKSFKSLTKTITETRELSRIEKLLDEDFETLAQARRALRQQSKPTKAKAVKSASNKQSSQSKQSKPLQSKRGQKATPISVPPNRPERKISNTFSTSTKESTTKFKLSEKELKNSLKKKPQESLLEYYNRLEASSDEYKQISGRWIFTFKGGRSKIAYGSVRNAIDTIRDYDLSRSIIEYGTTTDTITQTDIKFIPFKGDPGEYKRERLAEMEEARKRRQRTRRKLIKLLKGEGIDLTRTFGSNIDINEKAAEILEQLLKNQKRRKKKGE